MRRASRRALDDIGTEGDADAGTDGTDDERAIPVTDAASLPWAAMRARTRVAPGTQPTAETREIRWARPPAEPTACATRETSGTSTDASPQAGSTLIALGVNGTALVRVSSSLFVVDGATDARHLYEVAADGTVLDGGAYQLPRMMQLEPLAELEP